MASHFNDILPILLILLLTVEVLLLVKLDRLFWGTYLTPFVILAVPYLIVILLAYFVGPLLGFVILSYKVTLIIIVYLFIFWIFGSFLMMALVGKYLDKKKSFSPKPEKYSLHPFLFQISWLMILIIVLKLILTIKKFGGFYIWNDDFSRYFNSGFSGHLMTFTVLLLIYFTIKFRKGEKGVIFWIVVILLLLLIYQVKTWIFIPAFTVGFYYYLENKIYIKARNLFFVAITSYFIFLIIYFPTSGFSSDYFFRSYTYIFYLKHFLFYLFSGVLGFSENIVEGLRTNIDPDLIISPFINIYRVITLNKQMQTIVSDLYYFIDMVKVDNSNVASFFGTLIIYSGYIGAGIFTIITGFIMYFLLMVNFVYKNIWLLIMYLFLLSGLGMGWFNFYLNNLNFVEIPVYCIILAVLSEIRYSKGS